MSHTLESLAHSLDDIPARYLTTEELSHVLANRRAREAAGPPALQWEQRERTPQDKAYRFAQFGRSMGAEDDLISCSLTTKLRGLGYNEDGTAEVLLDVGVAWRPRSAEERLIAVAAEMLAAGWDMEHVRWAIDGLVPDGR